MSVAESFEATRWIGARMPRREDARLLTGRGRYVDDVALPNLLHVAFVRSTHARATIRAVETGAAAAHPGVRAVLTIDDLAAVVPVPEGAAGVNSLPLARGAVSFVGDPVALVVARSRAVAEDACELVEVDYDALDPLLDPAVAAASGDLVHPALESNINAARTIDRDDELDALIERAAHVVTETLHQHRYLAVPMETRGVVASFDAASGELSVWLSSQGAHAARDHFAAMVALPTNRVRVITHDVGGGFGLKISVGREETAVAIAARALGASLKWIEDRWENLIAAPHARAESATVSMALDEDGHILTITADHTEDVGAYGAGFGSGIAGLVAGAYKVRKVAGSGRSVRTNTSRRGAYRGPWMFETTAREAMLDIAAREIGIDPLELRRRNVLRQEDLPWPSGRGVLSHITPAETLEHAAELIDYAGFRAGQVGAREAGRLLGIGIALFVEPSGGQPGAAEGATIRIDRTGAVQVIMGIGSQGHSIETTMVQVVADALGVDAGDVVFVGGDTALTPYGGTTGGSRSAVMGGGAARHAALAMRAKVLEVAANAMEAAVEDLDMAGGVVSVRGTPSRTMTLAAVASAAHDPKVLPPGMDPGLEVASRWLTDASGSTYSNACHMCTCEVDPATGQVSLLRYVVSEDCGVMINPTVVEGQIAGGVVQGIGGALYEHFVYDALGNPLTTTFLDYLLPTASEVPDLEYDHIETPSERPGGFKGMGEGGAIGAPAAVFNAVADALAPLGVKLTRQPLTPVALLEAMDAARARA
ncbi:MAG: xanthine dehydrogenase family protein molybdopterin-binding subunit [Acidimicrobiia bacterium]